MEMNEVKKKRHRERVLIRQRGYCYSEAAKEKRKEDD